MSRFFRRGGDSSDSDSSSSEEEELLSQDESDDDAAKPSKPSTSQGATTGAKPMSRFLRTEDSGDSDSDSDSDSEDDSDEGEVAKPEPAKKRSQFLKNDEGSESSDEESVKHIVKSAKDKRMEELETSGAVIEQKIKINDWAAINTEFDKLTRLVQRQNTLSGSTAEPSPPVYLRVLSTLDKALSDEKEKDSKKKMEAAKARALNTMRQKLKKTIKEYEAEYKAYTEDVDAYTAKFAEFNKPEVVRKVIKVKKPDPALGDDMEGFAEVGKGGRTYGLGSGDVFKSLAAIQEARGKKSTDRNEAIRILEHLHGVANTTYSQIRVLLALISARFDYNAATLTHMPIDTWRSAQTELNELLNTLLDDSDYVVVENSQLEYDESIERLPTTSEPVVKIRGSVISFVDRLDDEFTRSLQNIDPHGTEYVERLKDEKPLYEMICRAQIHFERSDKTSLARTMMRRLEHIYSKPIAVVTILDKAATDSLASLLTPTFPSLVTLENSTDLVRALCVHLYGTDEALLRTRAMLCHVYHHAFMNHFHIARDLFLMSHLSEHIQNADVTTQILFNRAVVQLGLCAFRSGLIKEAQATLQDIFTTQRVKELLAQGVHQQRYVTLTPEQERAERQRQLPFHMHINTELLEAAFLVSSMLVEIPLLASIDNEELKRKAISKPFRRLLDFADRQIFSGPPETTRDHIMQASKALQDGEWEKCRDLVQSIKIWSLMPEEAAVKEMLARRIQEEGLRTYLFTYSSFYASLSLEQLAATFSLPVRTVTATVSKMIWNEDLAASLDQSTGTVAFHRTDVTRVQQLAQTLADRVTQLADSNAKTLDVKLGGGANWQERGEGGGGGKRGGAGGEGGGAGGDQQGQERNRNRTGGQRGGGRGRGQRFAQGLGGRVVGATAS